MTRMLLQEIMKCMLRTSCTTLIKNHIPNHKQVLENKLNVYQLMTCYTNSFVEDINKTKVKSNVKTVRVNKITVIHPNNSISVMLLEDAQKLAKKHNWLLIPTCDCDPKSNRSIYKLETYVDLHNVSEGNNTKQDYHNKKKNTTKLFTIKSKICAHDLEIKITNINKVLGKGRNVKITVIHPDGKQESLIQHMNKNVNGIGKLQKSQPTSTTYIYTPLLKDQKTNVDNPSTEISETS